MENLGLDSKLLIAQLVNFGIFFFVFQKFISKPFLKYLKNQKEQDALKEKMSKELAERQSVLDEKDKELERERKKVLEAAIVQSKKDAETVKHEILEQAKKDAADILAKAQVQLEDEREKLYKDMRKQIASVSMVVVEKALKDYLTRDAQEAITKNIITYIPEEMKLEN